MRSGSSRAGTAPKSAPAVHHALLILVVALLGAGCSAERAVPTRPAMTRGLSMPAGQDGDFVYGGKKDLVVVTLAQGADAVAVAAQYGAVLNGNSWRVAGLQPPLGLSSDLLITLVSADNRVVTAEKNIVAESAETRQESYSFDDAYGTAQGCAYQPANAQLGLHQAHLLSRGGGIKIAVIDTGADPAHPMLAGRVAGGWDFVDDDADFNETGDGWDNDYDGRIDEALGHGTHVAGVLSIVAPDAQLLVARVLDGEGRGTMQNVARAIRWSVANGARVINLSLGSLTKSDAVQLALQEAVAAGVVNVCAAGNWGAPQPEEFPASSRYSIAVGAHDGQGVLASFSSWGEVVELVAPGVEILSAYRNGGYARWSGTSMAAPYVSGTAALVLAVHPSWTQKATLDRLELSALNLDALNPTRIGGMGAGALRPYQALLLP